jgi:hypothetical protein
MMVRRALLALPFLLVSAGGAAAQNLGDLWFMPNLHAADWKQLFLAPGSWARAVRHVSGLELADLEIASLLSDQELALLIGQLKGWDMALSLQSGAVKEWGCTPDITSAATLAQLDRIRSLGGQVDRISMDEPLIQAGPCGISQEELAARTLQYIALIEARYPNILVGDIEPWPSQSAAVLESWIDQLSTSAYRIAFLTLDVDYQDAIVNQHPLTEISDIGAYARFKGVPFRIIIWNSNALTPEPVVDDATEYDATLKFAAIVSALTTSDGADFESWDTFPITTLPDTTAQTLTNLLFAYETAYPPAKRTYPARLPSVASIVPASAPVGSSPVITLTGSNFDPANNAIEYSLPGGPWIAIGQAGSQDGAVITLPPIHLGPTPQTYSLLVRTPAGNSAPVSLTTVLSPPAVASIVPASAPVGSSPVITLTGSNFDPVSTMEYSLPGGPWHTMGQVESSEGGTMITLPPILLRPPPQVYYLAVRTAAGASNPVTLSGD